MLKLLQKLVGRRAKPYIIKNIAECKISTLCFFRICTVDLAGQALLFPAAEKSNQKRDLIYSLFLPFLVAVAL